MLRALCAKVKAQMCCKIPQLIKSTGWLKTYTLIKRNTRNKYQMFKFITYSCGNKYKRWDSRFQYFLFCIWKNVEFIKNGRDKTKSRFVKTAGMQYYPLMMLALTITSVHVRMTNVLNIKICKFS